MKQYLAYKQRRACLSPEDGRSISSGGENTDSDASLHEHDDTTARVSAAVSSAAPKPVSEQTAEATPTESDLIPYNEAA